MIRSLHDRIDVMRRADRCKLYYLVGLVASAWAWYFSDDSTAVGYPVLGLAAAFLFVRLIRELRPDRMALPPEMRFIRREPRP